MKKIHLTIDHCKEVLENEILIGSDKTSDGKRKRFVFVPWLEMGTGSMPMDWGS